jgi:hypothetical protein
MRTSGCRRWIAAAGTALGIALSGAAAHGALATNLENVIVYPNPFQPGAGHTAIVFNNLTENAKIRVYKMTGELVADTDVITVDGTAAWDATNKDGDALASGLYLYLVTNDAGQKKTGKLAILR